MAHRTWLFAFLAVSLLPAVTKAAEEDEGAGEVEKDDPRARLKAMREWRGNPSAGTLEEAGKERDRYGIGQPQGTLKNGAAVAGNVFINIGPTRDDLEVNGASDNAINSGRARNIVTHPANPNILYMATSGGGVWKSYDKGAGWEPITDQLGTTAVGALAMDPSSPEVLYLGFGDFVDVQVPGIVRSLDGGASWSAAQLLKATYTLGGVSKELTANSVRDIKVDPLNSSVVLVATNVGLFRSTDAGTTYTNIQMANPSGDKFYAENVGQGATTGGFWSLAYAGANTWLATATRGNFTDPTTPSSDLGLFRSTDNGATWTWALTPVPAAVTEVGRSTLATALSTVNDAANTSRVFMVSGDPAGSKTVDVFRTDDSGLTWIALGVNAGGVPTNPMSGELTDLNVMHAQAFYNQAILVDPNNPDTVFVGGDNDIIRSTDGGKSWSIMSAGYAANQLPRSLVHVDFHAFAAGVDGTFYSGSDGGIYASANAFKAAVNDVTFDSTTNNGLVTHLIYNVACSPESWPADMQGWVAGGLQDNGTRVRKGTTTTFDQLLGGDGIGLAFSGDAQNGVPGTFLASFENGLLRSTDGGQSFSRFQTGLTSGLPFFVRVARDEAAAAPDVFLTFTDPAAVYRSSGGSSWADVSGQLHWKNPVATVNGFTVPGGGAIGLRNIATHPKKTGLWGAVSNKYAYVTANGGADWNVSLQPKPTGNTAGVYKLSSIAFDTADQSGNTYYVTTATSDTLVDDASNLVPAPASFAHLYKTADGGATWSTLGDKAVASGGLPSVPANIIKVDPSDANTLYLGTEIGLYRSTDGGANWSRFGGNSLPLVSVSDLCITASSKRLTAATYGRGFWQISTDASVNPAGVKGRGDTNFDLRVDGRDLLDLADAFGSTQASANYRYQADLTGTTNAVDDADLTSMKSKFGGQP